MGIDNLADTTDLLDQTTLKLVDDSTVLTPVDGVQIIDQWITPLSASENTKPIADELLQLKSLLQSEQVDGEAVTAKLSKIADQLSLLAPETGSEGEMPSLIEGLASALRLAGGTSK